MDPGSTKPEPDPSLRYSPDQITWADDSATGAATALRQSGPPPWWERPKFRTVDDPTLGCLSTVLACWLPAAGVALLTYMCAQRSGYSDGIDWGRRSNWPGIACAWAIVLAGAAGGDIFIQKNQLR